MAYNADLITVLKLMFENVTQTSPSGPLGTTAPALNEVYQAHKLSDTRRQMYRRISETFQQDQQIPGRDEHIFRRLLCELLGYEPVSPPSGQVAASTSVGSGVASSSHPTRKATSPPLIGVAASSHHSTQMPSSSPQGIGEPAPQSSPSVWSRLCPCLGPPSQRP